MIIFCRGLLGFFKENSLFCAHFHIFTCHHSRAKIRRRRGVSCGFVPCEPLSSGTGHHHISIYLWKMLFHWICSLYPHPPSLLWPRRIGCCRHFHVLHHALQIVLHLSFLTVRQFDVWRDSFTLCNYIIEIEKNLSSPTTTGTISISFVTNYVTFFDIQGHLLPSCYG